ncbi:glycosyltransferase [Bradyrhizobium sp. AUGA SZCCT0431]|uniref:glycosyltransferase n=1 Tax=Bradyrhizobium sp. AUGA SZCCT0431 TaxID=2807674 RepID=UPI001BA4AF8C|nr:glycosyltransferase [Bradyrhizobium sp. AUGA SZCCT0431]MBR1142364.1 glycosyltransferase [Bradyrhizobium sp. AUGA SZCCT0431]
MAQPVTRPDEAREASALIAEEQAIVDRMSEEISRLRSEAVVLVLTGPVSDALFERLRREPRVTQVISQTSPGVRDIRRLGGSAFRLRTALIFWSEDFAGLRWAVAVLRSGALRIVKVSRHPPTSESISTLQFIGRDVRGRLRLTDRLLQLLAKSGNAGFRRLSERIVGAPISRLQLSSFPINRIQADGPIVYASGSLGAGGSERQLSLTAKGISSRSRRHVSIICQSPLTGGNRFFASELEAAGIVVEDRVSVQQRLNQGVAGYDQSIRSAFRRDPQLVDLILFFANKFLTERPAIVHAWLDEPNIAAGIGAVIAGVPKIVLGCRSLSPLHFQFYQPYMWQAYRELAKLPQVTILNNSVAGARDYAKWLQLPIARIKVIPNGLDFSSDGKSAAADAGSNRVREGKRVVGTVGRIAEEKRPYLWLEIASNILKKRPDVHFVWAGDGPMRKDVERRAEQLGISAHLSLLGLVSDISAVWPSMTVFLLTSRVEGLPNVSIEAQHFGVPAVVAAVGGCAETINEGVTGASVAGEDAQAFAEAVLRFLDSPEALARTKSLGPALVQERFSVERMIAATMDVYELEAGRS